MCVRKPPALSRQTIDVRRMHIAEAVLAHIAPPHVVGENNNDIWLRGRRNRGGEQRSSRENHVLHLILP